MALNVNKKRAQVFLFDLIFSFVILIVSIGIFISYYSEPQTNSNIRDLNLEILSGLSQTKVNSLNNEEIRDMFLNNEIINIDNTVAQQISEFQHTNRIGLAENLSSIFMSSYLSKEANFELLLNDSISELTLFEQRNRDIDFNNSRMSSVSSRLVFGFVNRSDSYGPHIYTLRIWQ